ncbi:MAG: YdcF family protein [Sphingomonas sp.]|nr:YdcF family protein [Sphingomonas sp.]
MIRRLVALIALAWVLGFGWFMLALPGPADARPTDAIVVLTGGAGRIDRGLELLRARAAKRMLVSGVDPKVRPIDLAVEYKTPPALFACCIDLGREAVDTRSNAEETRDWVRRHGYKSVRLVTSDWHLRRARLELAYALGPDVTVEGDGVAGNPRAPLLLAEYNKYLLRRFALAFGLGG